MYLGFIGVLALVYVALHVTAFVLDLKARDCVDPIECQRRETTSRVLSGAGFVVLLVAISVFSFWAYRTRNQDTINIVDTNNVAGSIAALPTSVNDTRDEAMNVDARPLPSYMSGTNVGDISLDQLSVPSNPTPVQLRENPTKEALAELLKTNEHNMDGM